MTTRRVRVAALAAAALIGGVVATSAQSGVAGAAPEVPWYQRPVTVGTGFSELPGILSTDLISASGRWVVVDGTVFGPGDPSSTTYLRDRWTDATTVIRRHAAATAISAGGTFVAGVDNDGDAWIHEISTGRVAEIPKAAGFADLRITGINDDGYFITTDGSPIDPVLRPLHRAGRFLADGSVTPVTPSAAAEATFFHLTPSLQYAVTEQGRVDLTTGAVLARPILVGDLPTNGDSLTANVRSAAISPSGRYVALGYVLTRYLDHENEETTHIDLWDTQTGQLTPIESSTGYNDINPRAVLDDGRVLSYRPVAGNGQIGDLLLVDPNRLDEAPYVLSRTFAGAPSNTTSLIYQEAHQPVATDIDRALICSPDPLSAFDTDTEVDCYLKPFPNSPLAN